MSLEAVAHLGVIVKEGNKRLKIRYRQKQGERKKQTQILRQRKRQK